jgi:hypothetical protein
MAKKAKNEQPETEGVIVAPPVPAVVAGSESAVSPDPAISTPAKGESLSDVIIRDYNSRKISNLEVAYFLKNSLTELIRVVEKCAQPQGAQIQLTGARRAIQGRINEKEFSFYGSGNSRPVEKDQ